jgi:hypothetical protein
MRMTPALQGLGQSDVSRTNHNPRGGTLSMRFRVLALDARPQSGSWLTANVARTTRDRAGDGYRIPLMHDRLFGLCYS